MKKVQEELIIELIDRDPSLTYNLARTWVELMWDDIATSHAKATFSVMSEEKITNIIRQWIKGHGEHLKEFIATNPRYKHLLEDDTIIH